MFEALPTAFDSSTVPPSDIPDCSRILTKNEYHLAHYDHVCYPYTSLMKLITSWTFIHASNASKAMSKSQGKIR